MAHRYFSMSEYWNQVAKNRVPKYTFQGKTRTEWEIWKEEACGKLQQLLGEFPEQVPLEAEVEYVIEDRDLVRERVIFDSEAFMSVPCQVIYPQIMSKDKSNPAILCCSGHPAELGKDPVAGFHSTPEHTRQIEVMNYNYGEQMARAGFFVIIPELRAFGERNETMPKHDTCDMNFLKGSILGMYTLTLNIWDMKCCLDYLETRDEVDAGRIGMMGLSFGGTMTAFTAAVDPRIKAADISGYVNPFQRFAIERENFCGSQIVPEIYKYFDTHDIAGLIAPRPLLLEMGIYDECFYIQDLLKGYRGVEKIYEAAGAEGLLQQDIHANGHSFAGNKAFAFFKHYL